MIFLMYMYCYASGLWTELKVAAILIENQWFTENFMYLLSILPLSRPYGTYRNRYNMHTTYILSLRDSLFRDLILVEPEKKWLKPLELNPIGVICKLTQIFYWTLRTGRPYGAKVNIPGNFSTNRTHLRCWCKENVHLQYSVRIPGKPSSVGAFCL